MHRGSHTRRFTYTSETNKSAAPNVHNEETTKKIARTMSSIEDGFFPCRDCGGRRCNCPMEQRHYVAVARLLPIDPDASDEFSDQGEVPYPEDEGQCTGCGGWGCNCQEERLCAASTNVPPTDHDAFKAEMKQAGVGVCGSCNRVGPFDRSCAHCLQQNKSSEFYHFEGPYGFCFRCSAEGITNALCEKCGRGWHIIVPENLRPTRGSHVTNSTETNTS
jgi:hypothetical protein